MNLLLAREEDPRAATSDALAVGVLCLAPFSLAFWDVGAGALPYAAGSAASSWYLGLIALSYALRAVRRLPEGARVGHSCSHCSSASSSWAGG